MSEQDKKKEIKTDWSLKELGEIERNNLIGFFALLLKVDKRINPNLYAHNGNTDNPDKTK